MRTLIQDCACPSVPNTAGTEEPLHSRTMITTLRFLAGAADNAAFHFLRHRYAELVADNESDLVGEAKIA